MLTFYPCTRCRILRIDDLTIYIDAIDARDGSPLLDIKSYFSIRQWRKRGFCAQMATVPLATHLVKLILTVLLTWTNMTQVKKRGMKKGYITNKITCWWRSESAGEWRKR